MHTNDFYVVLPSNSSDSAQLFPENRPSSFRIKLAQPISLFGNWEVGVAEIHMPFSWYNVDTLNNHFQVAATNMEQYYQRPKGEQEEIERKRKKEIDDMDEEKRKRLKEDTKTKDETTIEKKEDDKKETDTTTTTIEKKEDDKKETDTTTTTIEKKEDDKKETNGVKNVMQKPDDITRPPPPSEMIIKMEAGTYRNASHFFKKLKRKMAARGLSSDFIVNYHPGKNGKPSTITVNM